MNNGHSAKHKSIEHNRYDKRAEEIIEALKFSETELNIANTLNGASAIPIKLRSPYIYYERLIQSLVTGKDIVLELGSGIGLHTGVLISSEASVIATDISKHSIDLLKFRYQHSQNCETCIADVENLPFKNKSFNFVVSVGALSYGENRIVMNEVHRVLKPGGYFICVDSLNHNPIYRVNRWIHYLRGNRSLSTLTSMPKISTLLKYRDLFGNCQVRYFGSISWTMPLLGFLIGDIKAAEFSDYWDRRLNISWSAFKFVMLARKIK